MNAHHSAELPRHIAIIMDGNGRWAEQRRLPRAAGHRNGVTALRKIVEHCVASDIPALTVYAFSSENWGRPRQEVSFLLELFMSALDEEVDALHENRVCLRFIGECTAFSQQLQATMAAAQKLTAGNGGLSLNIAVNYGGRWDIVQAARELALQAVAGRLQAEEINEALLCRYLSLAKLPEPDLFIRTGGERRVSNYLLWQIAYTELYFSDLLWPEFSPQALDEAILWFQGRQRRFGRTAEQIEQADQA